MSESPYMDRFWLIHFDDADVRDEVFTDEEAARKRSAVVGDAFNHTLFVEYRGFREAIHENDLKTLHSDSWAPQPVSPLRMVDIPQRYFPEKVGPGSFDPDTLRMAAEAHCRHPFDHTMEIKAWVVLYLLDVWEAASEAAEWHAAQGQNHVTDTKLYEAVTGKEWRDRG